MATKKKAPATEDNEVDVPEENVERDFTEVMALSTKDGRVQ